MLIFRLLDFEFLSTLLCGMEQLRNRVSAPRGCPSLLHPCDLIHMDESSSDEANTSIAFQQNS
jgi:hypothetical protein